MFTETMTKVRKTIPLTHCMTNYVTVNACANALLAAGGAPIMADDIDEVSEIVALSKALVINIGTLNRRTITSMITAGCAANEKGIPVVLDPVGAGATALRNETVNQLLKKVRFAVIRGNVSELKYIYDGSSKAHGVDVDLSDTTLAPTQLGAYAQELSNRTGAVIAMTGKIDVVAHGHGGALIANGHPYLAGITGSGCMLSAITGAYVGANPNNLWEGAVTATALMGYCGEKAAKRCQKEESGLGSFAAYLLDNLSNCREKELKEGLKVEIF